MGGGKNSMAYCGVTVLGFGEPPEPHLAIGHFTQGARWEERPQHLALGRSSSPLPCPCASGDQQLPCPQTSRWSLDGKATAFRIRWEAGPVRSEQRTCRRSHAASSRIKEHFLRGVCLHASSRSMRERRRPVNDKLGSRKGNKIRGAPGTLPRLCHVV